MAKKLSASSRPGKQIRWSAESIWSKPLTEPRKKALGGVRRRQKRADPSDIDYSDIPALSDKQLAQFRRPPKKLVAVRLVPTYSNGFSGTARATLRASTMSFGQ